MSDGATEQLKKFVFKSKHSLGQQQEETLEVVIPEV